MSDLSHRHPSTQQIMRWFETEHLKGSNKGIVNACHGLAISVLDTVPDDPELVAGLRKLVEAKDCFVRANVAANEKYSGS